MTRLTGKRGGEPLAEEPEERTHRRRPMWRLRDVCASMRLAAWIGATIRRPTYSFSSGPAPPPLERRDPGVPEKLR